MNLDKLSDLTLKLKKVNIKSRNGSHDWRIEPRILVLNNISGDRHASADATK